MNSESSGRTPVIADVARAAGVSVPTVSRVLTGSTPVSAERRERVLRAIKELGFRPNEAARSLKHGHRSMIAVIAGNTARWGYARTIQGIEEAARQAGFSVIIAVAESAAASDVDATVDLVLRQSVAGVIVLEFDTPGREALARLPEGLPVVAAAGGARRSGRIPYALLDERSAGRAATEYLLSMGHATVHHVAVPAMGKPSGRSEGWAAALDHAGIGHKHVWHATWEPRHGYQIGLELAARDDVTAVFCGNDDLAIAVMAAFQDRGLRVPQDVSVMGFDNQPLGEFWRPALSTVEQDFDDLGSRAFRSLAALLTERSHPGNSVETPQLVLRQSTAVPRHGAAGR